MNLLLQVTSKIVVKAEPISDTHKATSNGYMKKRFYHFDSNKFFRISILCVGLG